MFRGLALVALVLGTPLQADEAFYVAHAPKIDGFADDRRGRNMEAGTP